MNALSETRDEGVSFQQTGEHLWIVTVDGTQCGYIEREGFTFRACGYGQRVICGNLFQLALDKVAERHREHVEYVAEQKCQHDAAIASLMAMTDGQKARAVEALEGQIERLPYAPLHIDIGIRKQQLSNRIAMLKGVRA